MTSQRRLDARPQLEAERALREEDLEPGSTVRAPWAARRRATGWVTGAVDEIDDMRVVTDLIERKRKEVEPLRLSGRLL